MPRAVGSAPIGVQQGTEPHMVLSIEFSLSYYWFATKQMTVGIINADGSIVSVSEIKTEVKKGNSATVSTVSITIIDTDALLKARIDTSIFEKAKGSLYLYYEGDSASNCIPMVVGNIVGPVSWDETTRLCTFQIESTIQDQDCGFAPTVSDFGDLDPDAQGIAWPMIFGTCAHVPAVKVKSRPIGALIYPIQLYTDTPYNTSSQAPITLDKPDVYSFNGSSPTKNSIYIDRLDQFPSGSINISIGGVVFQGSVDSSDTTKFNVTQSNLPKYTNFQFGNRAATGTNPLTDDDNSYATAWMPDDIKAIANCYLYIQDPIQGTVEHFNYCEKQVGRKVWLRYPFAFNNSSGQITHVQLTSTHTVNNVYPICRNGLMYDIEHHLDAAREVYVNRKLPSGKNGSSGSIASVIDKMKLDPSAWWQQAADAQVVSVSGDGDLYIASLVQLSSVKAVYGKRQIKDIAGKTKEVFVPLPTTYYTLQLTSNYPVAGQYASGIIINPPLATYKDQNWQDVIYVTGTSTVGPNPCDIIAWIVTNFTTLTMDTASVSASRGNCRDANFAMFEKREAVSIIEEIAWQARLGIIQENGTVSLRFLPTASTSFITLDDSLIDADGGYVQTQTPLQSVVTKLLATWTDTYKERRETLVRHNAKIKEIEDVVRSLIPDLRRSRSETHYYIYQNNIPTFGTRTQSTSVYIFNEPSAVKECIDFWGYRDSNVWKSARIKSFPYALSFQVFDIVTIDMADTTLLYAGSSLTGLIVGTAFVYAEMAVYLDVIFPVKAGSNELVTSKFWPGNTFTSPVAKYGDLVWPPNNNVD